MLNAADPPTSDPNDPPWPERCGNCGKAHHIQKCPEILAALRDAEPNPGRAIWQHSHKRAPHFYATLRQLDLSIWQVLAASCAAFEGVTTVEVLDRWLLGAQGTNVPAAAR
jgi:hypothetical protein